MTGTAADQPAASPPGASRLTAFAHRLNAIALALSVLLLAVMVGVVIANVIARYLLHVSLTWSAELARYCLVWSALLAAASLVQRGEHLAVDVLTSRLPSRPRRSLAILAAVLSLAFYAVLLVSGVYLVHGARGQSAASIAFLPMSIVYAVIPLSALVMFAGGALALHESIADARGTGA